MERQYAPSWLDRLSRLIFSTVILLVVARFLAKSFYPSSHSASINLLYQISGPLMAPFQTGSPLLAPFRDFLASIKFSLDFLTFLLAIIVYFILGTILMALARRLQPGSYSSPNSHR